jgi:hypothetical protein
LGVVKVGISFGELWMRFRFKFGWDLKWVEMIISSPSPSLPIQVIKLFKSVKKSSDIAGYGEDWYRFW